MPNNLLDTLLGRQLDLPPVEEPKLPKGRPASMYPRIDRAVSEVERENPVLRGVNVEPWDPFHYMTNSTIVGSTPVSKTDLIELNPMMEAAPQDSIQSTIVHELQHVLQNRALKDEKERMEQFDKESLLPYDERPSEKDASSIEREYRWHKRTPNYFEFDPAWFDTMIDGMDPYRVWNRHRLLEIINKVK